MLEEEYDIKMNEKSVVELKFKTLQSKANQLVGMEKKVDEVKRQLAEASKKLPNDLIFDLILEKSSIAAQDLGIELRLFEPQQPFIAGSIFKYAKVPIVVQAIGRFSEIVSFFDRIVHLEKLIYVEDINLIPIIMKDEQAVPKNNLIKSDIMRAKEKSQKLKLTANARLIIYRSLTPSEQSLIPN